MIFKALILLAIFSCITAFHIQSVSRRVAPGSSLSMEYIPDGLTKAQWRALKKKVSTVTALSNDLLAVAMLYHNSCFVLGY